MNPSSCKHQEEAPLKLGHYRRRSHFQPEDFLDENFDNLSVNDARRVRRTGPPTAKQQRFVPLHFHQTRSRPCTSID
jgi:hypothetical protein